MRLELRQDEEALASRESPPESSLSRMVKELVFDIDNGGPIMTCSYKDVELGLVELYVDCIAKTVYTNIIMFCCLVVGCEHEEVG